MQRDSKKLRVKLCLGTEIRAMFAVERYKEFYSKIHETFGKKLPTPFKLYYYDSDNDLLMVSNQEDYETALSQAEHAIKFFISDTSESLMTTTKYKDDEKKKQDEGTKYCTGEEKMIAPGLTVTSGPEEVIQENASTITTKFTNSRPKEDVNKDDKNTQEMINKFCEDLMSQIRGDFEGLSEEEVINKIKEYTVEQKASIACTENVLETCKILGEKECKTSKKIEELRKSDIMMTEDIMKHAEYKAIFLDDNNWYQYFRYCGGEVNFVWKVKNVGDVTWPNDTEFASDNYNIKPILVGALEPNDTKEIKITIRAPLEEGENTTNFRLFTGGKAFGDETRAIIVATKRPENLTIIPRPEPSPKQKEEEKYQHLIQCIMNCLQVPSAMQSNLIQLIDIFPKKSPDALYGILMLSKNNIQEALDTVFSQSEF